MNESFMRRYIKRNAAEELSMRMRELEANRNSKEMIALLKTKNSVLKSLEEAELRNFDTVLKERERFILPQLQFFITEQCCFNCTDCVAMVPSLKKSGKKPYFMDPDILANDLEILEKAVKKIRHCVFVGGEIFLHPRLGELIGTALKSKIIDNIELVTNAGVLPGPETAKIMAAHADKIYVLTSQYNNVLDLENRQKDIELAQFCHSHHIPFRRMDAPWVGMKDFKEITTPRAAKTSFIKCHFSSCVQLWDSKLAICPKARAGYSIGALQSAGEIVDLGIPENLFERLVDFYSRDSFLACQTCPVQPELVETAKQEK